jgi:simple sugar transport system permease protein
MTAYEVDSLWLGVLSGMAAGALVALLMALMSVTFRLDQVVSGLAIKVLAAGLTFYLFRVSFSDLGEQNLPNVSTFGPVEIPGLSDIPLVGEVLFSQPPLTYLALLAVPLTALFLGRTRHGLEIRVIGENPRAADMRGVNVSARQYAAVLFGGVMAGMAGAFLTLDSAGLFVPNISGGRGFIAFALVIVGNWSAWRILFGSLFFGAIDSLQLQLQAVGADVPYQLLLALPYLLTIVVLVAGGPPGRAPPSHRRPYARESSW